MAASLLASAVSWEGHRAHRAGAFPKVHSERTGSNRHLVLPKRFPLDARETTMRCAALGWGSEKGWDLHPGT